MWRTSIPREVWGTGPPCPTGHAGRIRHDLRPARSLSGRAGAARLCVPLDTCWPGARPSTVQPQRASVGGMPRPPLRRAATPPGCPPSGCASPMAAPWTSSMACRAAWRGGEPRRRRCGPAPNGITQLAVQWTMRQGITDVVRGAACSTTHPPPDPAAARAGPAHAALPRPPLIRERPRRQAVQVDGRPAGGRCVPPARPPPGRRWDRRCPARRPADGDPGDAGRGPKASGPERLPFTHMTFAAAHKTTCPGAV